MGIKPIWLCDATSHTDCKCNDSLSKQLDIWRLRIVTDDPSLKDQVFGTGANYYPIEPCPYCGRPCECDMVDVGVGLTQCGPFHCDCGASEIGMEAWEQEFIYAETGSKAVKLSVLEKITGWYEPGKPVSPHANTFEGMLVDHKTAKRLYEMGLLDEKPRTSIK